VLAGVAGRRVAGANLIHLQSRTIMTVCRKAVETGRRRVNDLDRGHLVRAALIVGGGVRAIGPAANG
jgi:hypothetical protein